MLPLYNLPEMINSAVHSYNMRNKINPRHFFSKIRFNRITSSSILLVTVLCFSFLSVSAQLISVPLTGDSVDWQFRMTGDSLWHPAQTPGTVHTDLLFNHLIPDPFFRSNEDSVQWVEQQDWEYQTYFSCPAQLFNQKNIEIIFEGLDTYADVYLNDTLILQASNMFRKYSADIHPIIRRQENHLLIHFYSASKKGKQLSGQLAYPLAGDVDGKAITRKAQYQYGWDWGPRLLTCGVYKNISLTGWSRYHLQEAFISQDSLTTDTAYLSVRASINSAVEETFSFTFSNNSGTETSTAMVTLQKGINDFSIPLKIIEPQRWWCNGLGTQKLYDLQLCMDDETCQLIFQCRFGIRTLKLVQEKDAAGAGFGFELNGVPVFMKGANYIPPDNFMPRCDRAVYEGIIHDAVACNMNMLRVWGGGVYAADEFYDLCDQQGILVWQDFMFAGTMVSGDSGFVDNVKDEVIDNVIRLRNHPSLAMWCGNNEIDEAWHNWGWQEQYHYDSIAQQILWNDYLQLFENIIPSVVKKYDPQRDYVPSSPAIGWGHKESLLQGDSHYWGVWWGDEPFAAYTQKVGRFMSEYGFQGIPAMSTIRQFTLPADRIIQPYDSNKFSEVMIKHEKHPTGFEKIDAYLERDYRSPKDFESYVYVSQLLQRDGMSTAIEAHRRAKPYCQGTLYWQLNDCWPVVSWSSRDYFGTWKALQYSADDLYRPFLISVVKENGNFQVYVVSDSLADVTGLLKLDLYDFNGLKIKSAEKIITVTANQSKLVFSMEEKKLPKNFAAGQSVLAASFSANGRVLAEKNYFFSKPKDLMLPAVKIEQKISVINIPSGDKNFPFACKVELSTDRFAKDVYLQCDDKNIRCMDNFFDLFPQQTKTITLLCKEKIAVTELRIQIVSLVDSY